MKPQNFSKTPDFNPVIGTPLVHIPDGEIFRVLCSCPASRPIMHTRRFIMANPALYRFPTVEELQSWQAPQT